MKENQAKHKNTISEIKNTLKGINCRLGNREEWIGDLEEKVMEMPQIKQEKEFFKMLLLLFNH